MGGMFALKMQRTIIAHRLAVTSVSDYLDRLTSIIIIIPTLSIRQCCWSTACPPPLIESAPAPIDGCDYNHWLVVMDPPTGYPTRHQIVQRYIQTLASAFGGSEEEAKKSMYSVSTKYYYAFGCNLHQNVIHTIKSMPNVKWILPDSHIRLGKNDYGGEPFIDGRVAPYDDMFHKDWLQDRSNNGFRRRTRTRRSRRKEHKNAR